MSNEDNSTKQNLPKKLELLQKFISIILSVAAILLSLTLIGSAIYLYCQLEEVFLSACALATGVALLTAGILTFMAPPSPSLNAIDSREKVALNSEEVEKCSTPSPSFDRAHKAQFQEYATTPN